MNELTNYLSEMFADLAEFPWWGWLTVAGLVILGVGLMVFHPRRAQTASVWNVKMLSLGAICIALSSVLSILKLFPLGQGGSVTPASMLPMMLFSYLYGAGPGLMLGAVYGVLQYFLGPVFLSIPQVLLDYPIAFAMCGLTGLFSKMKNQRLGLILGVVLASLGRYAAAVTSGVVFFAHYAPVGMNPLVYSLGYNIAYMAPECVICAVVAALAGPRLIGELKKAR